MAAPSQPGGAGPYVCPYCDQPYRTPASLERHVLGCTVEERQRIPAPAQPAQPAQEAEEEAEEEDEAGVHWPPNTSPGMIKFWQLARSCNEGRGLSAEDLEAVLAWHKDAMRDPDQAQFAFVSQLQRWEEELLNLNSDGWTCAEVTIHAADVVQFRLAAPITFKFWHKDPVKVVRELYGNPKFRDFFVLRGAKKFVNGEIEISWQERAGGSLWSQGDVVKDRARNGTVDSDLDELLQGLALERV